MLLSVIGASAIVSVVLFILLELFFRGWPTWRSMLTAAATPPILAWVLVFCGDMYAAVRHGSYPEEAFMGGLSIIGLPIAIVNFLASVVAILVFGALRIGFNEIVSGVSKRSRQ